MDQTTFYLGLGFVVTALYFLWNRLEHRRGRRALEIAEDLAALGDDAAPPSIHPLIDLDRCIGSGACVSACPERDVLEVVGGQARLINPLACIGHGSCRAACPVDAITLVFGTATRGVELPSVDPNFQTNLPGVYIVGELGGMGLIRNAVEQGRQAAQHAARTGRRSPPVDAVVVGSGPAGVGAALQLRASGLTPVVVEQGTFGGAITHYPRDKVAMTGTLELAGYGSIKRRTMKKESLLELWNDIRDRRDFEIVTGRAVDRLERVGDLWQVGAGEWSVEAAHVFLALGRRGSPRGLGVPGEELPKVHYRLLEPEPFEGKHVLVVGGGNAAADCALALADFGRCASVALSYRRTQLARQRGSLRAALEAAFAEGRVEPLLGTVVDAIGDDHVVLVGPEGVVRRRNDAVIIQAGGTAPADLLRSFGIDLVVKHGET